MVSQPRNKQTDKSKHTNNLVANTKISFFFIDCERKTTPATTNAPVSRSFHTTIAAATLKKPQEPLRSAHETVAVIQLPKENVKISRTLENPGKN